jgi:hypothetical protein
MTHPEPRVVELRQYTLHSGARRRLIQLFEREFIEPQEAAGLQVLGIFTDAADPDRFVWLRGFAGMAERRRGLEAFYGGPVWQRHRDEANATMIDSDNVLLLRPLAPWPTASEAGTWHALICPLKAPAGVGLRAALHEQPGIWLETEPAQNDFPRLPVRPGSWVLGLAATPPELPPALRQHLAVPPQRLQLLPTARSRLR